MDSPNVLRTPSESSHSPIPSTSQVDPGSHLPEKPTPTENIHLSYPSYEAPTAIQPVAPAQQRSILKDRLYVGNLHPSVDEYTLLQVFSRFGKISKMDYLFHKTGPLKGKPRGYAFVEYADEHDAKRALASAHDKLLRGRKLLVTYAQQAPLDQGPGVRARRGMVEAGRPTTLSLIKSASTGRADATAAKIAKMEAKLRQMEAQAQVQAAAEASAGAGAGTGAGSKTAVGHPSLPPRPVYAPPAPALGSSGGNSGSRPNRREKPALPSLPLAPAAPLHALGGPRVESGKRAAPGLAGVRIVKHKKG